MTGRREFLKVILGGGLLLGLLGCRGEEEEEVKYICPFHPRTKRDSPGTCPRCGMPLEKEGEEEEEEVKYTCPMHPKVISDEPGSCPECGMDLVKVEEKE